LSAENKEDEMETKEIRILTVGIIAVLLLIAAPAGAVSGGKWFNPFLTDAGLQEFNVTISSDIDRYNFAHAWMELNHSEKRPMRFLLPPLISHYGEGSFSKMERKLQWEINNSSSDLQKEFARKKAGYKLYLVKKYNLTLQFAVTNST